MLKIGSKDIDTLKADKAAARAKKADDNRPLSRMGVTPLSAAARPRRPKSKDLKFSDTTPGKIEVVEMRMKCMELRKRGLSYHAIGQQLGIGYQTAFKHVEAELIDMREKTELDTQSIRDLELARCDHMITALWPRITKGDPGAIIATVKIMDRRAKFMGLDAPAKTEWVGALTAVTPETASRMSEADIELRVKELMGRVANGDVIEAEQRIAEP